MARRVHGHDAHDLGAGHPGGGRPAVRAAAGRHHHTGLRRGAAGRDDRADPDHGPVAAVPRRRGGGHERAQRARPVRGGGARATRLQRGDHRGRDRSRAHVRHPGTRLWRGARRGGPPPGPDPVAGPAWGPRPAADRRARRAGTTRAGADGTARDRARGDAGGVPGDDQPGIGAGRRRGHDLQLRVHAAPDPDRRHRRAAGRRAPALAGTRGGNGRQGRVPAPARAGPVDARLR